MATSISLGSWRTTTMLFALQHMQSKVFVHKGLKGDLGLVAWQSGICCSGGSFGTQHQIHSGKLIGQPVKAIYDWYMQAAGLSVQLHKTGWKEKLTVDGHCPMPKVNNVIAAIREVQTES
ncbi:TPA: hypothetical protein ACH3X2_011369 [Trebouxia sp. C0005]